MRLIYKFLFKNSHFWGFLLIEMFVIFIIWHFYNSYEKQYQKEIISKVDTAFLATINGYAMVSQTLFDEVINNQKIINIFKDAHTATLEQRKVIRQKLFETLNPTYQRLKQQNLRQLHFHLPDNTSFLRFHKPSKFGDNLSKIRYSVASTNKYQSKHQGFEEGRIFNGFRYVFPLFAGEQHIGSVEASVSFNAIRQGIEKIYGLSYELMLRKDIVTKKLFKSELGHYIPCTVDDDFLCENIGDKQHSTYAITLNLIAEKLQGKLDSQLEKGDPFVRDLMLNNFFYEVVFYPIENVQSQHVAYVMTYNENSHLYYLRLQFFILFLSISITNSLIFIFFYHQSKNNLLIAEKNERLTQLNQDKNEFLGIAAHDLKNPLQGIQGAAELIDLRLTEEAVCCTQQCKQEISEFSQIITESAEHMFDLVTNLLDVNAIESGKMKIDLKHENVMPILQKIVDEYRKKAKAKDITLHFTAQKSYYIAYVDKLAFHQVLDNLVSNAIKYSPHDRNVYIHISIEGEQVRVEVEDEGNGISIEEQTKLFGKFVRLTPRPTGNEHSTGLGLFIVKKLVEAMQGKILCESEIGRGSKFIVIFPIDSHATS